MRIESQSHIQEELINKFFQSPGQVDLKAMFPGISLDKLNRNSSVHWNSPHQAYKKCPVDLPDNYF